MIAVPVTEAQAAHWILATGGLLSPQECVFLAEAAATAEGPALEVGNYTGLSTIVLSHGLPEGVTLTTVDTHDWRQTAEAFRQNADRYCAGTVVAAQDKYETFLSAYTGPPFSFVFYDAGHSDYDCETFWRLVAPHLTPHCQVLFDDADWASMRRLGELLAEAGFVNRTVKPFTRHAVAYTMGNLQLELDFGKRHPETFTIAHWERGSRGDATTGSAVEHVDPLNLPA